MSTYDVKLVIGSTDGSIAAGTEVSGYVLNFLTIDHGRQSVDETASASSCTAEILWNTSGAPALDTFTIGTRLQVWLIIDGYGTSPQCLFDGAVTDAVAGREILQVTAVNRSLAEIGRQTITNPSTIQAASASAFTTLYNLGSQETRIGTITGTTPVRIPAFDAENLLGILSEVAASEIGGYVTNSMPWGPTVVGNVYGPVVVNSNVTNRSQLTPDITFTGDEIANTWTITRRTVDLINRVTVFGTENATDFPAGYVVETNTDSVDAYGINERQIVTRLRYEADATNIANDKLERYYVNGWVLDSLIVLPSAMTNARFYTVLTNLGPDQYIEIPELFAGAPTLFFVEGLNFELSRHDLRIALYVSTAGFSRGAERWEQVTPGLTWDDLAASLTWADLRLVYI